MVKFVQLVKISIFQCNIELLVLVELQCYLFCPFLFQLPHIQILFFVSTITTTTVLNTVLHSLHEIPTKPKLKIVFSSDPVNFANTYHMNQNVEIMPNWSKTHYQNRCGVWLFPLICLTKIGQLWVQHGWLMKLQLATCMTLLRIEEELKY